MTLEQYIKVKERANTMNTKKTKTLRICEHGHRYYKSSDCVTCPTCQTINKPSEGFLALLSAPARQALVRANITTEEQLSAFTEKEILSLHGIGPSTLPKLKLALEMKGLSFKRSL